MLLQALGQRYVIEVVIGVDGCAQSLCDKKKNKTTLNVNPYINTIITGYVQKATNTTEHSRPPTW